MTLELPQAFRRMVPALHQRVMLIKDSFFRRHYSG
jgi:ABC-type amino acid transport system permease subunit